MGVDLKIHWNFLQKFLALQLRRALHAGGKYGTCPWSVKERLIQHDLDDAARPIIVCAIDSAIERPLRPVEGSARIRTNHPQLDGIRIRQVTGDLLQVDNVAPASHQIDLFSCSIFLAQIQLQDVQICQANQTTPLYNGHAFLKDYPSISGKIENLLKE